MNKERALAYLNSFVPGTLFETLGISFIDADIEIGTVKAIMPVTSKLLQPYGLLHGGATAAMAESVGSAGSMLFIDTKKQAPVGIEVTANHLRSIRSGVVIATGKLIHKGKSTHLWEINMHDEKGKHLAVCKLINFIKDLSA